MFLKLFSIISEILSPNSLILMPAEFSDLISTCRGETAIGRGSRLPLVISTSIKAKVLPKNTKLNININNNFSFILSTSPLG